VGHSREGSGLTTAADRPTTSAKPGVRALDYDRFMPQYRKVTEERIVTREEYERGYLERDGLVVRKRRYQLIKELPDGTYLVRASEQPKR
jgi:hypothetical protein